MQSKRGLNHAAVTTTLPCLISYFICTCRSCDSSWAIINKTCHWVVSVANFSDCKRVSAAASCSILFIKLAHSCPIRACSVSFVVRDVESFYWKCGCTHTQHNLDAPDLILRTTYFPILCVFDFCCGNGLVVLTRSCCSWARILRALLLSSFTSRRRRCKWAIFRCKIWYDCLSLFIPKVLFFPARLWD